MAAPASRGTSRIDLFFGGACMGLRGATCGRIANPD